MLCSLLVSKVHRQLLKGVRAPFIFNFRMAGLPLLQLPVATLMPLRRVLRTPAGMKFLRPKLVVPIIRIFSTSPLQGVTMVRRVVLLVPRLARTSSFRKQVVLPARILERKMNFGFSRVLKIRPSL